MCCEGEGEHEALWKMISPFSFPPLSPFPRVHYSPPPSEGTSTHPLAQSLQDPALLPPQSMRSLPGPQLGQLRHVPLLEPPQPVTYLFVPHEQEEHELCPLLDW